MRITVKQAWSCALLCVASACGGAAASSGSAPAAPAAGSGGPLIGADANSTGSLIVPMSHVNAAKPATAGAPSQPSAAASGAAPAAPGVPGAPGVPAVPGAGTPATAGAAPGVPSAPGAPPASAPTTIPWNTTGKTCLQAGSGQYGEPGPYKVGMMDVDLGMITSDQKTGMFTIFYPTPLEAACPHPIVAWGNGTGVMDSSTYAFFNSNAASWGIVVIASQDPNTGSGSFHKAGLDYLLEQNDDPMSMFYKKLSPRAGTSGHSQGAFGSVAGASHPNVSVDVGVGGGGSGAAGHASLCLTGTEDIASDSCPGAVDRAQGPFFAASWNKGDHVTTETLGGYISRDPGTLAMQRLYAAWFRCYLADDSVACNLFKGATPMDCGVCKEGQDWAVLKSKNIE